MRLGVAYNKCEAFLLIRKAFLMNQKKNDLPPKRLPIAASLEIIAALGGSAAVAQECGIRTASVSEWKPKASPALGHFFCAKAIATYPS